MSPRRTRPLILLLLLLWQTVAPAGLDLVTNNDTAWKVFHPDLLLHEGYKECRPFFKNLIAAGGDVVFLPWPKGKDFKKEIEKAFPGEKADFYQRFHHVGGLPAGQPEDIWMKDYLVFCEDGDRCTLLSSTDKVLPDGIKPDGDWRWMAERASTRRELNLKLGEKFKMGVARSPLRFEGGNFAKLGSKYALMTKQMFEQHHLPLAEKPTREEVEAQWGRTKAAFETNFKILMKRDVVWLEPLPGEGTGHVDMFLTVIGDTAFVADLPRKLIDDETDEERKKHLRWVKDILDTNADTLKDKGITVERIPMPAPYLDKVKYKDEDDKEKEEEVLFYPTYANSIQVKPSGGGASTIFIPDPDTKAPAALETSWKKKIQTTFEGKGMKVSWVPPRCNRQIEKGMGSLSCVTGACPSPVRKAIEAEEKKDAGH